VRLLFLIQGRTPQDHPGYHDGCLRLMAENTLSAYLPFCYYGDHTEGVDWRLRWISLLDQAKLFLPDVVFCQFFHGRIKHTRFLIEGLRSLPSRPTIASSCGDPFVPGLSFHNFPKPLRDSTRLADISFFTQMGAGATSAARWGAKNIVLWPHGICQVRFGLPMWSDHNAADFEVVFIGSHVVGRNPVSSLARAARARTALVLSLAKRYGKRFGLFGRGWSGLECWQGPVPYEMQGDTLQRGRLVVGGYPHSCADYYLSDRPFIAIGSGVPFLDYAVPKVDRIFRPGEHWYLYHDEQELLSTCDKLLETEGTSVALKAQAAADYVHSRHTQYHRMKFAIETMGALREARRQGRHCAAPNIDFLLSGFPLRDAVANWHG
jgi:hypothetical protein